MTTVPGRKHRPKISRGRRQAVYVRDNWTCRYCGLKFDPTHTFSNRTGSAPYIDVPPPTSWIVLEIDHIHPLCHGGTGELENLCAACTPCNQKKWINLVEAV